MTIRETYFDILDEIKSRIANLPAIKAEYVYAMSKPIVPEGEAHLVMIMPSEIPVEVVATQTLMYSCSFDITVVYVIKSTDMTSLEQAQRTLLELVLDIVDELNEDPTLGGKCADFRVESVSIVPTAVEDMRTFAATLRAVAKVYI